MNAQITLQLDPTTDTTGNAEQVARMIGVSAWHISGDYLVVENPLLDYRVTNNETYSHKTDRIPNGAVVILVQEEEPKTVEQQIEQEIQSKNLNAPRLTPADIDDTIVDEYYFTAAQGVGNNCNGYDAMGFHSVLGTLTFCVLVLKNGFTVTGESACASPENFDPEIGKKVARENARNKVWMLEGYLLKEKLNHQIKIQEHFASQGVDLDQPLDTKNLDDGKLRVGCPSSFGVSTLVYSESIPRDELSKKREYAHVLTQLLGLPNIDSGLRKKVEAKMTALLDELI
ncbi:Gp49 family protein [Acinetobacter junii]|uniref:Gp49 family protein n=1 Tax=Acinetobacter junii TaxID=40215 RepID=UPI0005B479CF